MRYTLLLPYPGMTAEELGAEALTEGMAAFDADARPSTTGSTGWSSGTPSITAPCPLLGPPRCAPQRTLIPTPAWLSAYSVTCTGDAPLEWPAHFATRLTPTRRQRRTSFGVL